MAIIGPTAVDFLKCLMFNKQAQQQVLHSVLRRVSIPQWVFETMKFKMAAVSVKKLLWTSTEKISHVSQQKILNFLF